MLEVNKIYNMDCLEGLKLLDDESVDLIVTDPPYNINYKCNFGSKEYKEKIHNIDWDTNFNFKDYYSELFRVLKNNSVMFVFGCIDNFEVMRECGFNRLLVWDKETPKCGDLDDFGIGYEFIYVFKKGRFKIVGKRINGVLRCPFNGFFENTLHPTQKPESIIIKLIEKSSNQKDLVLDCFMGSGTTAVVCKKLNRRFIGFEKNNGYCEIANKRLKNIPDKLNNYF